MDSLILAGFLFLALLITFIVIVSLETLIGWQERVLQVLDGSRNRPIRFIFFAALGCWLACGARIHSFSLAPVWHRFFLCLVCIYTFVFFNPQQNMSNAKAAQTVLCPDGLAYRLPAGQYIRCEDFDEFHAAWAKGNTRADLYLNLKGH
jgi:hypothetical protein